MISLEQVKLLETKVARAIEYVERVNGENAALQVKLESYQQRIDELEVLVMRFKEDQGRIEDGILAALDRLNQFEGAIEKSLREKQGKTAAAEAKSGPAETAKPAETGVPSGGGKSAANRDKAPEAGKTAPAQPVVPAPGEIFFEIPENDTDDDIEDPLGEDGGQQSENGELDIF